MPRRSDQPQWTTPKQVVAKPEVVRNDGFGSKAAAVDSAKRSFGTNSSVKRFTIHKKDGQFYIVSSNKRAPNGSQRVAGYALTGGRWEEVTTRI